MTTAVRLWSVLGRTMVVEVLRVINPAQVVAFLPREEPQQDAGV